MLERAVPLTVANKASPSTPEFRAALRAAPERSHAQAPLQLSNHGYVPEMEAATLEGPGAALGCDPRMIGSCLSLFKAPAAA